MRMISCAVLAAAVLMFFSVPVLARGDDLSPADLNALKSYALSMDKIKAMQAAMDEAKKIPAMKKMKDVGGDTNSIAEMEAKMNAMPDAMAVYRKHGLTAADAVLMPLTLWMPALRLPILPQLRSFRIVFHPRRSPSTSSIRLN